MVPLPLARDDRATRRLLLDVNPDPVLTTYEPCDPRRSISFVVKPSDDDSGSETMSLDKDGSDGMGSRSCGIPETLSIGEAVTGVLGPGGVKISSSIVLDQGSSCFIVASSVFISVDRAGLYHQSGNSSSVYPSFLRSA